MKVKVKYLEKNIQSNELETKNYIGIYFFRIRVKKIKLKHTVKYSQSGNEIVNTTYVIIKEIIKSLPDKYIRRAISRIIRTIKVEKLDMDLGINFEDPILNTYLISLINTVLPLYFATNKTKFETIHYNTFISDKPIYLKLQASIKIPILRNLLNIFYLVKVIIIEMLNHKVNQSRNKAKIYEKKAIKYNRY